jgi:endonuclease/exonuclease/phosphatase family metal-dependent hydrolase
MQGSGRRFFFYNTHFPHRRQDDKARVACARVIAERFARLPKDVPFIMTGDFNAPAGNQVYQVFAADLRDVWTTAARRLGPEGTSSGFSGNTSGRRIDWILYRGPFRVLEAETVTRNDDGRYPSDHFPVVAVFEFL